MLTQPNGPLYARMIALTKVRAPSSGNKLDVELVYFSGPEAEENAIGRWYSAKPSDLSRRLLDYLRQHAEAGFEGWLVWPYSPYENISAEIQRAPADEWSRVSDPDFGVYWVFMRAQEHGTAPQGMPPEAVDDLVKHLTIERHRKQVLRAFRFSVQLSTANRVATEYRRLSASSHDLPEFRAQSLAAATLFTYRDHSRDVAISAEEFRWYFNQRFIRKRLRSAEDVIECAEDYVCEEVDYRAALNLRLDKTPQFVEDRDAFAGFQALELYEKEHIIPTLGITDDDVEFYYRQHRSQFELPTKVSGKLVTFAQLDLARKWLAGSPEASPSSTTHVVVTELAMPRGLEFARDNLLQCAVGKRIGPFWRDNAYACFEKTRNIESRLIEPAVARETVRSLLTQKRLRLAERGLARSLATEIRIVDKVPYAAYGIPE